MISLKVSIVVAALAFCAAYWLNYCREMRLSEADLQMEHTRMVAQQMVVAENYTLSASRRPRVAIGLGSCVDIFIHARDFWSILDSPELAKEAPAETFDVYTEHLKSLADLRRMFGFFFKQGAAAERYFSDESVFASIVARLKAAKHAPQRLSLGGNAPVMANRLAKDGCDVLLGATVAAHFRADLHRRVIMTGVGDAEDFHIIVEYEVGDEWSGVRAPRANRFIFHRDRYNPHLASLPDFRGPSLEAFRPDAIVIGGLQMMDDIPYSNAKEPEELLADLGGFLAAQSRPLVHFEMASFVEARLLRLIVQHVLTNSDSIGLNEQELPNLVSMLETGKPIVLSSAYPRIATMLDQMRRLHSALQGLPGANRRVSRIHLHTVGFQAILTQSGSRWVNSLAAAARAALVAHRYTCAVPQVDVGRAKLLMDASFALSEAPGAPRREFNASEPVSCWEEEGGVGGKAPLTLCVAPGLVCTRVKQTGGAGDNISAAGLVPQIDPLGE